MGKGRTGRRRLHRKHGPNMQDRTHTATLPAGQSTEGGKSTGLAVPQPLRDAERGLPEAVLARQSKGCRRRGGSRERPGICAAPGREPPRPRGAPEAAAVQRHTRQTIGYSHRGGHTASSGQPRRRRHAPATGSGASPGSHRRAGLPALELWVSSACWSPGGGGDTDRQAPMRTIGLGGGSGPQAVL